MYSSRHMNEPQRILGVKTAALAWGFFFSLFGVLVGLAAIGMPGLLLGSFGGFLFGATLHTQLTGGRFHNHNLERIWGAWHRLSRTNQPTDFNQNKQAQYASGSGMESDPESLYGLDGSEIFGFAIVQRGQAESDPQESFDGKFRALIGTLLQKLPITAQMQIIKPGIPFEHPLMDSWRPILREKNVRKPCYYVFFSLLPVCPPHVKREILKELGNRARRLDRKEIIALAEWMLAPESPPSGFETPFYRITHFLKGKEIASYSNGKVHGAASLVRLPPTVDTDFHRFFEPIESLPGAIVVTFTGSSTFDPVEEGKKRYRQWKQNREKETLANREAKEAQQAQDKAEQEGDKIQVRMFLNCFVFGTPQEVESALSEFELRAHRAQPERRPVFLRDTAFIERSLLACLPGSRVFLPLRRPTILKASEASCYLPQVPISLDVPSLPCCWFRYPDNTVAPWEYTKPLPVFVFGSMGKGKSFLLAYIQLTHLLRQIRLGHEVASFSFDLGESFSFLEDGLAEIVLKLTFDSQHHTYEPLSFHPLAAFSLFGSRVTQALNVITNLLQRDVAATLGSGQSKRPTLKPVDSHFLTQLLQEFYEVSPSHTFEDFYLLLKKRLPDFLASSRDPDKPMDWENWLAVLKDFSLSEGGLYAGIVNPKNPKYTPSDFRKCRHLYAVKNNASMDALPLVQLFVSVSFALGDCMHENYSATSNSPALFNFMIDERHWVSNFVDEKFLEVHTRQGRKQALIPISASQTLSDLVLAGRSTKQEMAQIEITSRVFFYELPSDVSLVAALVGEQPGQINDPKSRINQCYTVVRRIKELQERSPKIFSVGYIQDKQVHHFVFDAEIQLQWALTTHSGGRAIRRAALLYSRANYGTVCARLAEACPQIPEVPPSPAFVKDVLKKAFGTAKPELAHSHTGRTLKNLKKKRKAKAEGRI